MNSFSKNIKFIDLQYLIDDYTFFERLRLGKVCLILGAGFSYKIKNQTNHPLNEYNYIPLSTDFIKLTNKEFSCSTFDFKESANVWKDYLVSDVEKIQLFKNLFLVDENLFIEEKLSLYKNIFLPNWYRIFTLNFDNVLETIIKNVEDFKNFNILSYPEDAEFPNENNRKYLAHIHGRISHDDVLKSLVFFSSEYGHFYEKSNNFYNSLLNAIDSDQARDLVIVGCKFNEDLIYKNVLNKLSRSGINLYHFDIGQPSRFANDILNKVNYHFINCSTIDFLTFLISNKSKLSFNKIKTQDYFEVQSLTDLHSVSRNNYIIENPIVGRFGNIKNFFGWNDIREEIQLNKEKLDFNSDHKVFIIQGKNGAGKSTLLFKMIDDYLCSDCYEKRTIIFLHPSKLFEIQSLIKEDSKFLIVIDNLDVYNDYKKVQSFFGVVTSLAFDNELDVKFLFTINESSWSKISINNSIKEGYNFFLFCYILSADEFWDISNVYDATIRLFNLEKKYPALDWDTIKMLVLEKANNLPAYVSYIMSEASLKENNLSENFFRNIPKGIFHLIWLKIKSIPESESEGVIASIVLLCKIQQLELSRSTLKKILADNNINNVEEVLNYMWDHILDSKGFDNLKSFDPLFKECVNLTLKNENLISDVSLRYFAKKYRDFQSDEFVSFRLRLIKSLKMKIAIGTFASDNVVWNASELLMISNTREELEFISGLYAQELKEVVQFSGYLLNLRKLLDHLWQQEIWQLQTKKVGYNWRDNQHKQYEIYLLLKRLVEEIYWNDSYKVHDFASKLRRFVLHAFDEDSIEYSEVKDSILSWLERSKVLSGGKDLLVYQAIAKFYMEVNEFDQAFSFVENGLIENLSSPKEHYKVISLYIIEIDIHLTKTEILYELNSDNSLFEIAKIALDRCLSFVESSRVSEDFNSSFDLQNAIRVFYTYLAQFVTRSTFLGLKNYPSYRDLKVAEDFLDYSMKYLPPSKDSVYAYAILKIKNFDKLYSKNQKEKIIQDVFDILKDRYLKFFEPKIRDGLEKLVKFADKSEILTEHKDFLSKIFNEKETPHIKRGVLRLATLLTNKIKENETLSSADKEDLNKIINQPFNFSTVESIARGILLECFSLGVDLKSNFGKYSTLLQKFNRNIRYKSILSRTTYLFLRQVGNFKIGKPDTKVMFYEIFIDFVPLKKRRPIYRELNFAYELSFNDILANVSLSNEQKVNMLTAIITKFAKNLGGFKNVPKKLKTQRYLLRSLKKSF